MKLKQEYLAVRRGKTLSYGGSQSWSKSRLMRKYGCGVVGMADVLLYLGLYHPGCETELTSGICMEDGTLSSIAYEQYLSRIRFRYLPLIPGFGVPGFLLPLALNRYFHHYELPFRAHWGLFTGSIKKRIENMLSMDLPVILAIGPNFPLFFGKRKVTFYRRQQDSYVSACQVQSHFVVVTGMTEEYLEVSSWGKRYYLSWREYFRYIRRYGAGFSSNICVLKKHKR